MGQDCSRCSVVWLPVPQGHCSVWQKRRIGIQVIAEEDVACPEPEHCHLFPSGYQVVGVSLVSLIPCLPFATSPPLCGLLWTWSGPARDQSVETWFWRWFRWKRSSFPMTVKVDEDIARADGALQSWGDKLSRRRKSLISNPWSGKMGWIALEWKDLGSKDAWLSRNYVKETDCWWRVLLCCVVIQSIQVDLCLLSLGNIISCLVVICFVILCCVLLCCVSESIHISSGLLSLGNVISCLGVICFVILSCVVFQSLSTSILACCHWAMW